MKLHDPACYDLACHFLGAAPDHLKSALAQHIQDTIEDWIKAEIDARNLGEMQ